MLKTVLILIAIFTVFKLIMFAIYSMILGKNAQEAIEQRKNNPQIEEEKEDDWDTW